MRITRERFGKMPDGEEVSLYRLTNDNGVQIAITDYGGIITSIKTPDHQGQLGEIVMGFDELAPYLGVHPYFGATVGRVANRISNAQFSYGQQVYKLSANEGNNQLHGGHQGLDKVLWQSEVISDGQDILRLTHHSPDGSEGYPGNLQCTVSFKLTPQNELEINYTALTDKATPVNFTHHDYFNLSDGGESNIYDHELLINSKYYTPNDSDNIPTGEIRSALDSIYDFSDYKNVGAMIDKKEGHRHAQHGYDDNFIINKSPKELSRAASLRDPQSKRQLDIYSTQDCLQLYTGNYLDGSLSRQSKPYNHHHALCLESQSYVDAPNKSHFPSIIIRPEEKYEEKTVYRFSKYP